MKILNLNVFEGRNIYSHKKCVRMDLDLEGYCEIPSKDVPKFNETLLKLVPELKSHHCGIEEEGGFAKRLEEGTYLSHICEHTILALQNRVGIDAAYGKAREIRGDFYYVIFQYEYKNTAIEIANIVVELLNALIQGRKYNLNTRMENLQTILRKEQLGPSTAAIVEEAKKKGIPVSRIGDGSIMQLGYGKFSKLIEATIVEDTHTIATDIASDKLLTKEVLYNQCIPIARGGKVHNTLELLFEAESIGYPIVLKPRYGNQGKGVFVNIRDEKEAVKAYETLSKQYKDIIIEKYVCGRDYRVCVVDGKVIAAAERIPPYVTGDGTRNIKELIEELNNDERRGNGHEKPLTKIKFDEKLFFHIQQQECSLETVLPLGKKINLRENANISTGGIAIDCTDEICEENKEICIRAAKAIGLNICGIDVCCEDISKPLGDSGVIIEINAAPGIRMHHYPFVGKSRNVAGAIFDMMFKEGISSIPVVSVTGTNGKTTTTRLIGHTLGLAGYKVGMTTTGGIYIDNRCIEKGDTTGPRSAVTILQNKEVDAAVLETARGGIIREGLAYDLVDVSVITNITEDHLGIDGITTLEELAKVKALVGEAVKPEGYVVLNADDKMSLTIIERMKSRIIFFSREKENPVLRKNIANGGIGVYVDRDVLYIESQEMELPLIKIEDICITLNGKLPHNIENAMAACAALIGLGLDCATIREGLSSFYCDEKQNPGRFNMYAIGDATVILDYGHNIEGYKAVLEGAGKLPHNRLIGVIGVPGDRLDSNVREVAKISAAHFDYIYVKEDEDKRGRRLGEIAQLLEQGVISSGYNPKHVKVILNEQEALREAMNQAKSGDLIIVFFEKFEPLLTLVDEKMKQTQKDAEITMA